jgi:hypothetical protein
VSESVSPKTNEPEPEWISVREAAAKLGVSERAVQIRAKRGSLRSRRDGGRWEVSLDGRGGRESVSANANENEPKNEGGAKAESESGAALLDQLRGEVEFLREQARAHTAEIMRRDQAEGELRRLMLSDRQEIAQLRQQLAITAAPEPFPMSGKVDAEVPDDSNAVSEPGAAVGTPQSEAQGQRRGFWARLFGRG